MLSQKPENILRRDKRRWGNLYAGREVEADKAYHYIPLWPEEVRAAFEKQIRGGITRPEVVYLLERLARETLAREDHACAICEQIFEEVTKLVLSAETR